MICGMDYLRTGFNSDSITGPVLYDEMWPLMSVHAVSVGAVTALHDRETLIPASLLRLSRPDSLPYLWISQVQRSCPHYYLSLSPSLSFSFSPAPPFSITCFGFLVAVALLSPCTCHLSLFQSRRASTVSHLQNSPPFQHSFLYWFLNTIHAFRSLFPSDWPVYRIGYRSLASIFQVQKPNCTWLVSSRLLTHAILQMPQIEQDGWSD